MTVPEPVTIAWRRLDRPGHDAATLAAGETGWRLAGSAVFLESGAPCHLQYEVELDRAWRTLSTLVRGWLGSTRIELHARANEDREWFLNGRPAIAVAGSLDIDLAFTPATNLLPIRRLSLPVGASAEVVAAWLPFPELDLQPLDQVYRRSAQDAYDYSSSGGSFTARLTVSPDGFVTDYPELWIEERG